MKSAPCLHRILACALVALGGPETASAQQSVALAQAKEAYAASVQGWLERPERLLARFGSRISFSRRLLNEALKVLEGAEFELGAGVLLRVERTRLRVEDGLVPSVELYGRVGGPANSFPVRAQALLVPLPEAAGAGNFRFRLQVVELSSAADSALEAGLAEPFLKLADAHARRLTETLPPIELPLKRELALEFPAQTLPRQKLNVRPGVSITGNLGVPALSLTIKLTTQRMVLTSAGLHVWVAPEFGAAPPAPPPPAEVAPAENAPLPERLAWLEAPADVAIWLHQGTLARLGAALGALPPEARTIQFQATTREGELIQESAYRVYLEKIGELRARATLGSLAIAAQPSPEAGKGLLGLALRAEVAAEASVHVHVNPPKIGGMTVGGGIGDDFPVRLPPQSPALTGTLALQAGPSGGFDLTAALTGPRQIDLPVQVDLGKYGLGKPTVTFQAPLPLEAVFRGKIEPLATQGEAVVADRKIPFRVAAKDAAVQTTSEAIRLDMNVELRFNPPPK